MRPLPRARRRALARRPGHSRGLLQCALAALLAASLPLWAPAASALPDDREQPIHITADTAVRDEKRGVTIYSGHVQMRQGSMELDADSLTIYHEAADADKFVARGSPAKMRQQPEVDKGLVHAHANVITYFRHREVVHLRTAARLTRDDGTLVTGDSIDYFIAKELVRADSDRSDDNNKVFVVIPPSLIEETREADGEGDADGAPEEGAPATAQPESAADAPAAASDDAAMAAQQGEPSGTTESE